MRNDMLTRCSSLVMRLNWAVFRASCGSSPANWLKFCPTSDWAMTISPTKSSSPSSLAVSTFTIARAPSDFASAAASPPMAGTGSWVVSGVVAGGATRGGAAGIFPDCTASMIPWASALSFAVAMRMGVTGRWPVTWPSISSRNSLSTSRPCKINSITGSLITSRPWRARSSKDSSTCASRLMGIRLRNPAPPLNV